MIRDNLNDLPANLKPLVTINPAINPELVARFNQELGILELNPAQLKEALQNPTLAEEFWHRRQDNILRTKGWNNERLQTDVTIDRICEVGIIPRMRDMAIKDGYDWGPYEFFRYAQYAVPLSQTLLEHTKNPNNDISKLLQDINQERLFDGVGWVVKVINNRGDETPDFIKQVAISDSKGETVEKEIRVAREEWLTGNVVLNLNNI